MKFNQIIILGALFGLSSAQVIPVLLDDNIYLLDLKAKGKATGKAGINEEVVIKKGGAKMMWDCENGHYLDKNDFKKGITKEKGAIVEFKENCDDFDRIRSNNEFAKKKRKDFTDSIKKGDKDRRKKTPSKFFDEINKQFDELDEEMCFGREKTDPNCKKF